MAEKCMAIEAQTVTTGDQDPGGQAQHKYLSEDCYDDTMAADGTRVA